MIIQIRKVNKLVYKFIISGTLIDLNKYTNSNRSGARNGAAEKQGQDTIVFYYAKQQLRDVQIQKQVKVHINWIEPDERRDPDNVASAVKFIFDGLVKAGVLYDDKRKNIKNIYHDFDIDRKNPRIEVTLEEV